jgi:hypothetical protein
MPIVLIILMRILFATSMVFIIGYMFGSFAKSRVLTTFARGASILVIVLFVLTNVFLLHVGIWHHGMYNSGGWCGGYRHGDTTIIIHK